MITATYEQEIVVRMLSWFLGDRLGSMWADFKTVTLIFTVDDSFMFYQTQPRVLKHTRTVVV